MDSLLEPLQFGFMQRGLAASVLVATSVPSDTTSASAASARRARPRPACWDRTSMPA